MIYDENCFERWADNMERSYLSDEYEREKHKCYGYECDNDADVEIDGTWYCAECAMLLEEILSDNYINTTPDPVVR